MRSEWNLGCGTLALVVSCGSAGCVDLAGAVSGGHMVLEERRFAVSDSPQITLATFDGSIDLRGWDRNEVAVRVEKYAPSPDWAKDIEVTAEQQGDRITVEVKRPRVLPLFGWHSLSAKLIVSIPRQSTAVASSRDGSIVVADLTGPLELHSDDGSIRGHDLSGGLKAQSADGSIRVDRLTGDVELETHDGSVVADGKFSSLRVHTDDGSIRIRADEGSATERDWDISTGDGSVVIHVPDDFGAELDAMTHDGRVHVEDVQVSNVTGPIERGRIQGRLGSGGRALRVRTGDGSVAIRRF